MTYASPGDFESRMASTTFYSQVMDLGMTHSARLDKYNECWNFYSGRHWERSAPEGFDQMSVNYIKAFVKKLRRFTFRNGWNVTVDDAEETDIDEYLQNTWKMYKQIVTNEAAENAGIFGDWYCYVKYVPPEDDPKKKGYIKLSSIDPRYVFPEYNSYTGEMELCYLLIPYEYRTLESNGMVVGKTYLHREIHFPDKILVQDTNSDGNVISYTEEENPIGKILIVHGINQPIPNSPFGCSDIEDLIDLQSMLNEKVSDVSDIIDYHAAPITVIYGAKARQLEKGANKVWSGLPANAKVENLKSEGNVSASMDFVSWLKTAMHELGNIPENALGAGRGISNTSAVALSIDLEPLIEVAEDKRLYFAKAVHEINERILDIAKLHGDISFEEDYDYQHNVEFGDMLPRDRASLLSELQIELSLGLETPRGALIRLGEANVDDKLEEIEEYKKQKAEEQIALFQQTSAQGQEVKGFQEQTKSPEEEEEDEESSNAVEKNPTIHGEKVVEEELKKRA